MLAVIRDWYHRNFTDPQAVILVLLLLAVFAIILFFGDILAPVIVALVMAYLLEGPVALLQRIGIPRTLAVFAVILVFITVSLVLVFGLLPVLSNQVTDVVRALPGMVSSVRSSLCVCPTSTPIFLLPSKFQF